MNTPFKTMLNLHMADIVEHCVVVIIDLGDGKLEVVGLESCIHLAQVKSGMQRGKRLCQCSKVTIRLAESQMQIC